MPMKLLAENSYSPLLTTLLLSTLLIAACNDGAEDSAREHVWQEQTGALDKARAVEEQLENAAAAQRRQIEAETR